MQNAARRTIWAAITRRGCAQGLEANITRRGLHLQGSDGNKKSAGLQTAAGLLGLGGLGLGSYTLYHISSQKQQQQRYRISLLSFGFKIRNSVEWF